MHATHQTLEKVGGIPLNWIGNRFFISPVVSDHQGNPYATPPVYPYFYVI